MPLLDLFWSMLYLFLLIMWFWLVITILIDIFRSHDLSGVAKALWVVFILVLPLLGVLIYVIARGESMGQRMIDHARQQDVAARAYIQDVTGTNTAEELEKLNDLKNRGVLTEQEFNDQKAKLLA